MADSTPTVSDNPRSTTVTSSFTWPASRFSTSSGNSSSIRLEKSPATAARTTTPKEFSSASISFGVSAMTSIDALIWVAASRKAPFSPPRGILREVQLWPAARAASTVSPTKASLASTIALTAVTRSASGPSSPGTTTRAVSSPSRTDRLA